MDEQQQITFKPLGLFLTSVMRIKSSNTFTVHLADFSRDGITSAAMPVNIPTHEYPQ